MTDKKGGEGEDTHFYNSKINSLSHLDKINFLVCGLGKMLLSWPKSSFGFFCKMAEQTFWPTQHKVDKPQIKYKVIQITYKLKHDCCIFSSYVLCNSNRKKKILS